MSTTMQHIETVSTPSTVRAEILASEAGKVLVRLNGLERWAVLARGVEAEVGDQAAVLDDGQGQPIVIAAHGSASLPSVARERNRTRLIADEGDLELGAPNGSVVIKAGTLVRVEGRMVDVASGSSTRIACGSGTHVMMQPGVVETKAGELRSRAKRLRLLADRLEAEGTRIEASYERAEISGRSWRVAPEKLAIGVTDLAIDVANAIQQKAGRVRTIVAGVLSVAAGRTRLRSKGRTSIDGEQIHLG